jgi:hypothetical protein
MVKYTPTKLAKAAILPNKRDRVFRRFRLIRKMTKSRIKPAAYDVKRYADELSPL